MIVLHHGYRVKYTVLLLSVAITVLVCLLVQYTIQTLISSQLTDKPHTVSTMKDTGIYQYESSHSELVGSPPLYKMGALLGEGYVSAVYSGYDINTNEEVVIKLTPLVNQMSSIERDDDNGKPIKPNIIDPSKHLSGIPQSVLKLQRLHKEHNMYRRLNRTHLVKEYWYGRYKSFQAMVLQRVGKSISYHQKLNRSWSVRDVHAIGVCTIKDLQQLHAKSYTHNDIHMGNIAFAVRNGTYQVNLIDFNSCSRYRSYVHGSLSHKPLVSVPYRVPIHRYSPPCFHKRKRCSRRDDMISLGYILIMLSSAYSNCFDTYFLNCAPDRSSYSPPLPWIRIEKKPQLSAYMETISYNILNAPKYKELLPEYLRLYFEHMESLNFTSTPDYDYLVDILSVSYDAR